MFIHVVMMSFKDGTGSAFHEQVQAYAARIRNECDGLVDYLYGPNEASRSDGLTHAVVATFDDEAAHERYQVGAVHQEMKSFMGSRIDRLVVFDSSRWG